MKTLIGFLVILFYSLISCGKQDYNIVVFNVKEYHILSGKYSIHAVNDRVSLSLHQIEMKDLVIIYRGKSAKLECMYYGNSEIPSKPYTLILPISYTK